MDFEAIKKAAEGYKPAMVKFLRDMIAIPSESCEEKGVVHRIAEEMKALGYDKVEFDKLGNVIGWMGEGDKIIALDSHVDTVGIGNRDNWEADPYQGYETDDIIYGRGGSDQEGGMASATYGARIMKDLGLIPAGYKIMVVGSVQEEDCDGPRTAADPLLRAVGVHLRQNAGEYAGLAPFRRLDGRTARRPRAVAARVADRGARPDRHDPRQTGKNRGALPLSGTYDPLREHPAGYRGLAADGRRNGLCE